MTKKLTLLERLCTSLGENNNAAYAVVAVATAKGIFRPLFTMMDKHQDYESRKYTALREGLTEVVAIPCYLGVAGIASKLIAPILGGGKDTAKTKTAAKTLSFVGVCIAALLIIPAACSAIINPIMEIKAKHEKKKKCIHDIKNESNVKTLDIKEEDIKPTSMAQVTPTVSAAAPLSKSFNAFVPVKYNSGLTIGGSK